MARQSRKPKAETIPPTEGAAGLVRVSDGEKAYMVPAKSPIGANELAAIQREAFEAYDYQSERLRYDTAGRKWWFYLDKIPPGRSVLRLSVSRLNEERTDTIDTSFLAADLGPQMCADVVARLNEALA